VSVRVRPLNAQEKGKGQCWQVDGNSLLQTGAPASATPFQFDHVFDSSKTSRDVYEKTTKSIIHNVVAGFNGTVFAYGQTSSGKTHTMRGSEEEPGVIPSAIDEIFETISKSAGREFLLRVSYMELYNEEIRDLLNPSKCKLQLHEDAVRGIYVAGLHEEIVNDAEQIKKLMEKGENSRHVGETNMNSRSSRSHTIFKMVIESRDCSQDQTNGDEVMRSSAVTPFWCRLSTWWISRARSASRRQAQRGCA